MKISKKEMKEIFKKHNLKLWFPANANSGEQITDYNYLYSRVEYKNSDLRRFKNIIKTDYKGKYKISNIPSNYLCSVRVERIQEMTTFFEITWQNQSTGYVFTTRYTYDGTGNQKGYTYLGWLRHCIAFGKQEGLKYIKSKKY